MSFDIAPALGLKADSSDILKAANDLDKFVGASDRAGKASDMLSGSTRRIVEMMERIDRQLTAVNATLKTIASGMGGMSTATQAAANALEGASGAAAQAAETINRLDQSAAAASSGAMSVAESASQAAVEADKLTAATQGAGSALVETSARAEQMAAAAARITEAEELAAKSGLSLSEAQMAVVGSGRMSAEQMIEQALAADNLGKGVNDATKTLDDFSKAANDAGSAAVKAAGEARKVADNQDRLAEASRTAGTATRSAISVLADLAQQAATGRLSMADLTSEVSSLVRSFGGMESGAAGAGRGVAGLTTRLGAAGVVAGVAAAGVAVAAVAIGGAFALATREINKSNKDIVSGLGLTEKQLERVKEKGVDTAVTIGDTFFGFFDVVGDRLKDAFAGPLKWLADAWNATMDFITKWGAWAVKQVVGYWGGAIGAIRAAWKGIGPAMGDAVISAANVAIGAVEKLINFTIDGINALVLATSPLLAAAKQAGLKVEIGHVSFDRIENKFAGQGKALMQAITAGFLEGRDEAIRAVDRFFVDWADASVKRAQERIREAAGKAEKAKKAGGGGKEKDAWGDFIADIARQILMIEAQTKALELSDDAALRLTNQQKLLGDAQKAGIAITDAQRSALMKLAGDLTDAQIALKAAENLKDVNKGFEDQIHLLGQAAERIGVHGAALVELTTWQDAYNKVTDNGRRAIDAATDATLRNNAAKVAAKTATNDAADFMERFRQSTQEAKAALEAERGAIGLSGAALEAWRFKQDALADARRRSVDLTPDLLAAIDKEAAAYGDARHGLDQLISAQDRIIAQFQSIAEAANDAAQTMSSAFGSVGGAIGDVIAILADYGVQQEQIKTNLANKAIDQAEAERQLASLQLNSMGAALGAAKNLFKEHTTGYKAMAAAEKAFAVVQMANTAINVAAGAAKMFATLGPFGFPAVAAMVAVMAGLGAAVSGGKSSYKAPTAEDIQKAQGTGSVLGAADAKSASIANSLDRMVRNTNRDLEYSNEMVRSLRAIESNIGALTNVLARQLNVPGGGFDTAGLGLGSKTSMGLMGTAALGAGFGVAGLVLSQLPVIGDILGGIVKTLFGTKKTVTLLDQGISFAADSVENIINNGIVGQIYQDVQTQTKKKFLGLTTSNKTSVSTTYGDLGTEMERQVALIIGSLRSGVLDAAAILGVAGAEAALDAFQVNIGKISLKDLKGSEIQDALSAVFSKLGDDMAAAALPGLEAFQKVGEGMFETIVRLADDYRTIDTALASIGMTFGAVGFASVRAREDLIDLFGSLEGFAEATSTFREKFLTEAEQMAPIVAAVAAEMARLGHAGVTTIEQFKTLVLGLDLSSAAGADMYASLMAVAPAFARIIEYQDGLAQKAADLQLQYMQLSGDEVGALAIQRQREIDAVDASLRPLLERIHALQDEQSAAAAAAKVAEEAARVESQRASMEIEYYRALGRESVAVVLQRAAEIRAMDESLRPLQAKIWLLQDQAKIEAEAAALAHSRSQLLVQLLQAEGDAVGAVALQRRLELEAMDESLRPMQQMIYDLADAAAEAERLEEAARAAAEAEARLAEQRSGLQLRLLEALGDAEGALAMRREQELAAADASLRGLIGQIHAAEDAAKAAEALRQAQEEQARAAEAAAKAAEELARTRTSMEIELLRALGKETEALAAQRAMELAALDQSLHALQNQIYAAQDAAAAQAALAQEQAAAATEAERLAGIARTARGLQADILELEGDAIAATAVRRALELEAMDASLHPLQQRIYQLRDEAAAAEEAARAAEELAEQARRTAEAEAALARQRQGMEADILELEGKAAEAMAIRRALEMEALDASLHPLQIRIYQLRDEAAAAQEAARAADELAAQQRAAAELARTRIGMEAQILELQGDAAAALLIRRQLEIEAMDESLRPLQQLINSLTDARDAAEAAARAEADLAAAQAEIAGRRRALDIELLDAMGLAEEALAARRADELAALDESLRPLQQLIWQYRDAATEAEALARAQADAAAEAERLAQAEAQLAKQRQGLEAELLEALGRSVEAVALRRQMELAALDQSLHALQQQVWAAQDAAAANAELARQQAEAAEAAEEAARAAEALRKAGVDLHIRYFDLLGDSAAATALRRQEELAATDASLHALLRQIYALEDAKAAEDAYAQALQAKNSRVDDARKALSAAYDREAGALGRTIDQFTKFGDSLREFRAGLFLADTATAASYRQMQVRLIQTAALAATGDIAALGGLQGVSKDFLAASRAQSSTLAQYQRDVAFVARSVDAAIGASDEAVDYAQAQLAALDRLVGGYIDLNDNVLSVNQAIWQLKQTMAQEVVPQTVTPIVVSTERQTEAIDRGNAELKAEIAMLKQTLASLMTAVAENTGDLARIIRRMDGGDFLKVGSDPDTPVHVANADGKPLIVVEETP